jgi:toxin ParE1/3/4
MPGFRLSAKALNDLKSIGRYTERHWGRDQRNKYLSILDACFHAIAERPWVGIPCDFIKTGYQKYHVGRHLVFYRQNTAFIEIIRILHDGMDVERHF